jgi:CheY-like chemotaxis protein
MERGQPAELLASGPIGKLVREGRLEEALVALYREHEKPSGPVVTAIHELRERVTQGAIAKLEPLDRAPTAGDYNAALVGIAERYLLEQLVDGVNTLERILDISTLGRHRTARALANLFADGTLVLDRGKARSPDSLLPAPAIRDRAPAEVEEVVALVADANPTQAALTRTLVRVALGKAARVIRAESGPAAVDVARKERAGLLLLDFTLPGFDALEVLRQLRQPGGGTIAAVVFVDRLDADFVRGKLPRGAGLVVRPVDKAALADAISRAQQAAADTGRRT